MIFKRYGEPMPFGPFVIDGEDGPVTQGADALEAWTDAELLAHGITREPDPAHVRSVEQLCAGIDTMRDQRQASDFEYDFGPDVMAVLGDDAIVPAGVRFLQMEPRNKSDWMAQHARALAAIALGREAETVILVRCEDNANVLCPPRVFLDVFEDGAERDQNLMIAAAKLKGQQRAAYPEVIDLTTGWPV